MQVNAEQGCTEPVCVRVRVHVHVRVCTQQLTTSYDSEGGREEAWLIFVMAAGGWETIQSHSI